MDWFETIRRYYTQGLWTAEMVRGAVTKNKITKMQYDSIVNHAE